MIYLEQPYLINPKSDFELDITQIVDEFGNQLDLSTVQFECMFFVKGSREWFAFDVVDYTYLVSFDGVNRVNNFFEDGKLVFTFNGSCFCEGELQYKIHLTLPDERFGDRERNIKHKGILPVVINSVASAYLYKYEDVGRYEQLRIITSALNLSYKLGDTFNPEGMVVEAVYEDGSSRHIDNSLLTYSNNGVVDSNSIQVRYTEQGITNIATQQLTLISLSAIRVITPPNDILYEVGDTFNPEGMVVEAVFTDNSRNNIADYDILNGNNLQESTSFINISYTLGAETRTTTQEITVQLVQLQYIDITTPPRDTEYNEGYNFNPSGMRVTAYYSNGTSRNITEEEYDIIGGLSLQIGTTSVTISYTENGITKTDQQPITVVDVPFYNNLLITKAPNKVTYTVGEDFNPEGMVVEATYSDNTRKVVTDYEIIGGENLQEFNTYIDIRYTESGSTNYARIPITVNAVVITLDSIDVITNPKTTYYRNEPVTTAGMIVRGTFSDGSTRNLTASEISVSPTTATQTELVITGRVNGVSRTDTTNIVVRTLTSISVDRAPDKVIYNVGENFDDTGMTLHLIFDIGEDGQALSDWIITNGTNLQTDDTSVGISYTLYGITRTTTQAITVNAVVQYPTLTEPSLIFDSMYIPTGDDTSEAEIIRFGRFDEDVTETPQRWTTRVAIDRGDINPDYSTNPATSYAPRAGIYETTSLAVRTNMLSLTVNNLHSTIEEVSTNRNSIVYDITSNVTTSGVTGIPSALDDRTNTRFIIPLYDEVAPSYIPMLPGKQPVDSEGENYGTAYNDDFVVNVPSENIWRTRPFMTWVILASQTLDDMENGTVSAVPIKYSDIVWNSANNNGIDLDIANVRFLCTLNNENWSHKQRIYIHEGLEVQSIEYFDIIDNAWITAQWMEATGESISNVDYPSGNRLLEYANTGAARAAVELRFTCIPA